VNPTAIALILVAAVAHASWNLFSKQAAAAAEFFIWPLAVCAAALYLPVVVITIVVTHPRLALLNWVFLAGTGALQSGYFLFLQLGYRSGDLSVAYPIGRGTGALLAAVAGITLLGERPTPVAAAGIIAIVAGVVIIGLTPGSSEGEPEAGQPAGRARVLSFALVTGAFIASYTIWDKYAVASLHTPPILQGYAAFPIMVIIFAPFVLRDRGRLAKVWQAFRPQVIGAAVLAPLAYILVLFALSFTAVSAVAPAREVSVLFGVILGRRMLGEGSLARRLGAAAAIVAGIIAIAVG
jgi:drug/metabolite transporter (DMT)-like permease